MYAIRRSATSRRMYRADTPSRQATVSMSRSPIALLCVTIGTSLSFPLLTLARQASGVTTPDPCGSLKAARAEPCGLGHVTAPARSAADQVVRRAMQACIRCRRGTPFRASGRARETLRQKLGLDSPVQTWSGRGPSAQGDPDASRPFDARDRSPRRKRIAGHVKHTKFHASASETDVDAAVIFVPPFEAIQLRGVRR